MVREEFAADIKTADGGLEGPALDEGRNGCMGVTGID